MLAYLFSFMFFSGLFVFSLKRKHLLLMLLSLEYIVLSLYINMFYYISMSGMDYFFLMIFLTMSVCEGALGLAMLISMIRMHGNDYIMSLTFLW
uniref:NADH-ubiquinone oxidoreductase chain 4L n=1 Tax=Cryptolestes ferrugineus TaxID=58000 RepID=A0A0U2NDF8_9CUCU|nr:NADH dehydrogenase subunit 4L [Cryptolestes ferrugineus]ALI86996.1 NADH dehydrogenase subunit 4L [Cryptolestes ferrugineus]